MEIERKFLVPCLPEGYDTHPFHQIEQAYLCTDPVVRIRQEDEDFCLTYKGKGLLSREEYNAGLILAEVEVTTEEEALSFQPPKWFGRDVTFTREYQNSRLACGW